MVVGLAQGLQVRMISFIVEPGVELIDSQVSMILLHNPTETDQQLMNLHQQWNRDNLIAVRNDRVKAIDGFVSLPYASPVTQFLERRFSVAELLTE